MTLPSDALEDRRAAFRRLLDDIRAASRSGPAPAYRIAPESLPKRCTCCGVAYDAAAWASLPLLGVQFVFVDDSPDEVPDAELRNCPCRSTLAVKVDPQ